MEDRSSFGAVDHGVSGSHQRIAGRDSMFLQARATRAGRSDAVLRVRNLSAGGMMAETDQSFVAGEPLQVELRGVGIIPARIAWIAPPRLGIAFDAPIDPKLARKAPPQSPGTTMMLIAPVGSSKRPGLKER